MHMWLTIYVRTTTLKVTERYQENIAVMGGALHEKHKKKPL